MNKQDKFISGSVLALGCAFVGWSRWWMLKHPQPGTGKAWLWAAVAIALITLVVGLASSPQSPKQR